MLISDRHNYPFRIGFWIGIAVILIGVAAGFLSGDNPTYLGLAFVAGAILVWFFASFEQAVLGLLILRSALDLYSDQGLPAAYALGLNALILIYIIFLLLTKQAVKTDWFFWFFAAWVAFQSMWLILMSLNALGTDPSLLQASIREWVRVFSWLMTYLLVMQLKDRVLPRKAITALFLGLIFPYIIAVTQALRGFPRLDGSLGHPNNFATFNVLFLMLGLWKITCSTRRILWVAVSAATVFFLVGAKSMTGLAMLAVFVVVYFFPRLNARYLVGGIALSVVVIALFTGTELGQERLNELYMTPLLNPEMDWSYAMAIQLSDSSDANSFNWRLVQWAFLLQSWQEHPLFGYGLGTVANVSVFNNAAHNDYVRFLVETGIVGLTSFIALMAAQIVRLIQLLQSSTYSISHHNFCRAMFAFLIAMLVGMLTGNVWDQTAPLFYWWTALAIVGWDWPYSITDGIADLQAERSATYA